jgi:DNA polymerase-4/DNA polymerase V
MSASINEAAASVPAASGGATPDFITLSSYPKAIVHIDCDAFFTSCEAARDPSLRGRPVVTGKERGIISCPSYEAKALGIKRGVRLSEAKRICPDLVILPGDYELYSSYSVRVFEIIGRFTPDVEEYSVDEAFCDLTGLRRLYRAPYPAIARAIKDAIQRELGITVSVGISLTKALAKLASKHNKPDGFTEVPGHMLHEFLEGMPLDRVCGFGPNSVALLNKCGVRTVLEYIRRPRDFAKRALGKIGEELWHELRGVSVYPVVPGAKESYLTISKTKTFSPSSCDGAFVRAQLFRNMESALIKLRRHCLCAAGLEAHLTRADFSYCGAAARLTRRSSSALDFTAACGELFGRIFVPGAAYRATGVVLSDIAAGAAGPADLFDDPVRIENIRKITAAVDSVNSHYGKHTLHLASSSAAGRKEAHPRNSPAWRKANLLKGESSRRRLAIPLLKSRLKSR